MGVLASWRLRNNRKNLGDWWSEGFKDLFRRAFSSKKGEMGDATYFTCLKMLSESMGKLPIHLYERSESGNKRVRDFYLGELLKIRPNPYISPGLFWSTVEVNRLHHGNAFVYIFRKSSKIDSLWIMQSEDVEVIMDNEGVFGRENALWYKYIDPKTGSEYLFHHEEVLHFRTSSTFDGIMGVSVREQLKEMIAGNIASNEFLANFYKGGLSARAVLQYTSDLQEESKSRLIKGLEKFAMGTENAGKIIPIPIGMQLSPLEVKLTDAQFVELRKLNNLQIASAFGVKPNHLNDYSKSSYANSEMQNLSFYTDTLLYIIKHYEEEMTYKLLSEENLKKGYYIKFNVGVILRADQKTQAEVLAKYVNNGIKTPNEARELLDMEQNEHGDVLVMNGNYIKLEDVGLPYLRQLGIVPNEKGDEEE